MNRAVFCGAVLFFSVSSVGATEKLDTASSFLPSYAGPAKKWYDVDPSTILSDEQCRDAIYEVRAAADQRVLDDRNEGMVDEKKATMISAVDTRIDECAVLVAHGDPQDIRPVPIIEEGPPMRRADHISQ